MYATGVPAQQDSHFDVAGLQALRGTVVAVQGDAVRIRLHGGDTYTVLTGPNTHYAAKAGTVLRDPARPGDTVFAGGELDAAKHTLGALFLAVVDPAELAQLDERQAQWGKTWLAGTILAKQGTELVVQRPDGVRSRVRVDADTSFRKQHQSITYPEVQVGDGMTATGAVAHDGMLTARVLTVVDAALIREWSRLKQ